MFVSTKKTIRKKLSECYTFIILLKIWDKLLKKKYIQFILIILTFSIGYLSFKYFLNPKVKTNEVSQVDENQIVDEIQNNLVKNLNYDVKFNNKSRYNITAELSELTYENGVEIVLMQKVKALVVDKNGTELKITSDYAIFNNATYDTDFSEFVNIKYLDHLINSNKLNLDFANNIAKISENLVYEGSQGVLTADNMIINLITKNVEIFMNSPKKNVEILTKE